jgi:hypothetical protein
MLDWSALWAAQTFFLAPVRRRRVLPLSFDAMGWHNAALNRSRRKAVKILVGVKKISELDAYELIWLHATQKRLTMAEIAVSIMNGQETLGGLGVPPTPMQTSSSPPVEQ